MPYTFICIISSTRKIAQVVICIKYRIDMRLYTVNGVGFAKPHSHMLICNSADQITHKKITIKMQNRAIVLLTDFIISVRASIQHP